MILPRYPTFRRFFAQVGAPLAGDGLPAWPGPVLPDGSVDNTGAGSLLRVNGFMSTVTGRTAGGHVFAGSPIGPLLDPAKIPGGDTFWPLELTCNAFAADGVSGVHEYDAFFSDRRDVGRYPTSGSTTLAEYASPPFLVTMPDASKSGTIALTPNTSAVAKLLPGLSGPALLTPTAFSTLFRNCAVYFQRRSDKAIQWAKMYAT